MENEAQQSTSPQEINKLFEQAVELHQQGHQKQAQTLYKQIIEQEPNHDQAYFLLGVVNHQFGDNNQAIAFISKAIDLNKEHCVYHYQLARIYAELNQLKPAAFEFKAAIKTNKNFQEAYCELADLYFSAQSYDKALRILQKAREYCPDSIMVMEKQAIVEKACHNIAAAVILFQNVLEVNPKQVDSATHLAEIYLHAGEYAKAESILLTLLSEHPNHFEGFINLGHLHFLQHQYEQALTAFKRAQQLQPHSMETLLYVSNTFRMLTDHQQAIQGYQMILQNTEANITKHQRLQALAGLSLSYSALGLPQAATLSQKLSEKLASLKLSTPIIVTAKEAQALNFPSDLVEKIRVQEQFHHKMYSLS